MSGMCCVVTGRVQGVGFRAATRERALALGLTGQAVNCADGTVEVSVSGDPAALAALEGWLHQGPPAAQVVSVMARPCADPPPRSGFRIS